MDETTIEKAGRAARTAADEVFDDLRDETPRAAIIIGAAKVDHALTRLLTKLLPPCPEKEDRLLGRNGFLSTFYARTITAHRLGLIDGAAARALHKFRDLRNDCAHEELKCSDDDGSYVSRIMDLAGPWREGREDLFRGLARQYGSEATAAGRFFLAHTLGHLRGLYVVMERLPPPVFTWGLTSGTQPNR